VTRAFQILAVLGFAALVPCLASAREKVTVYSFTSRIAKVEAAFEARFPDIDVVAVDLTASRAIARLIAEQDAGRAQVDVLYLADAPSVISRLWNEGRIETYVPARVAEALEEKHRAPLLAQRLSTKVLLYNSAIYPNGSPVSNLWELTLPAWRGRVTMVDPTQRGDYLDLFTEISLRDQEMAEAHLALFGAPVTPDGDLRSTGEQFLRNLFRNNPVLLSNTTAVNNAIGGPGARHPHLGFGTYSDIRDNIGKGWALKVATDVSPAPGIAYPVILTLARGAPNPNGGRKLIDFMMGDEPPDGGLPYAPFHVVGDYPARSDLSVPAGTLPLAALGAWEIDAAKIAGARNRVATLLLSEIGQ
jgi:iron(III) transport system substrate-binding protein